MTKHNKRRLAVELDGEIVGVLEDIDLLSFLAGNSQLVAARIDRAANVSDLARAAKRIDPQIRTLRRQGVKIDVICEIVSDLNRRLHARLFSLIAPDTIRRAGCLIVMGSEGRGEQTFRTDQDNGLILRAPVPEAQLEKFRRDMFDALAECGFPPCPGEVMLRNPAWSKTVDAYREDFPRGLALGDDTGIMSVAIFYDADATAGDPTLLTEAKQDLIDLMRGERVQARALRTRNRRLPDADWLLQQSRHLEDRRRRARFEERRHLSADARRSGARARKWAPRDEHHAARRAAC